MSVLDGQMLRGEVRRAQLMALPPEVLFNQAALALDAGDMGAFEWNSTTDHLAGDANFCGLWGVDPDADLTGEVVFARVHPDDLGVLRAEIARSMETGEDYKAEFRVQVADGEMRWLGARGMVTKRDAQGAPVVLTGLNWDISETKALQHRLEHLAREMNHRVNNSFAVIESLLSLGARTSPDVASFSSMMKNQIHALADAHRLLADHALHDMGAATGSDEVNLQKLATTALSAWSQGAHGDRLEIDVDAALHLTPRKVSGLAMLIYELATNATKYGPLGTAPGHLRFAMTAEAEGRCRLFWRETLEAPRATAADVDDDAAASSSTGFGTMLIRHCLDLLDAKVEERSITADGFTFAVLFPLR
ncbi:sensor histidine kinase [Roseobacter sp. A03A-229]